MGISLQGVIIGILVIGMVMLGFTGMLIETSDNYGITVDTGFSETFDRLNETQAQAVEVAEAVEGSSFESAGDGSVTAVFKGGIGVLKLILDSPSTFVTMIEETGKEYNIPARDIGAITAIILIIITFAIIAYLGLRGK